MAAHCASILARVDPDATESMNPPPIDEIAERRARQLAALEREGLLDDSVRVLLQPHELPPALAVAHEAARKGGPGWKHYGRILGQHVPSLFPDAEDELIAIASLPVSKVATARLDALIRSRLPAILDAVDRRHEQTVLDAALREVLAYLEGEEAS